MIYQGSFQLIDVKIFDTLFKFIKKYNTHLNYVVVQCIGDKKYILARKITDSEKSYYRNDNSSSVIRYTNGKNIELLLILKNFNTIRQCDDAVNNLLGIKEKILDKLSC